LIQRWHFFSPPYFSLVALAVFAAAALVSARPPTARRVDLGDAGEDDRAVDARRQET
jgi:hypothetical protein